MKYKTIEKMPLKKYRGKSNKHMEAQITDEYIVLDLWSDGKWIYRHAMNLQTGEYATYLANSGRWQGLSLGTIVNNSLYYWYKNASDDYVLDKKIVSLLKEKTERCYPQGLNLIEDMEHDYSRDRRERRENSRIRKINEKMENIPTLGKSIRDWIAGVIVGDLEFAFLNKKSGEYHCTACQADFTETAAGINIKHGKKVNCPNCGHSLRVNKKTSSRIYRDRLMVIHNLDQERGIVRFFDVFVVFKNERNVILEEGIRWMLYRDPNRKIECFYESYSVWDTKNPLNRREQKCYLYPGMLESGLKGTRIHSAVSGIISQMAEMKFKTNYASLLLNHNEDRLRTMEYMFKGRFFRLLQESIDEQYRCSGLMDYSGEDILHVMKINDRQKINRLRDKDGGWLMLGWLQWSDMQRTKLSDKVLEWCDKYKISVESYEQTGCSKYMSPEQMMNYLERQHRDDEKKSGIRSLMSTYRDYMDMAQIFGKNLDDEMVHRPRELKRRHNELVKEMELRKEELRIKADRERAEREAQRMEEKYPGSGAILEEIRPKYEYEDESFRIIVPRNFFEITMEGMALHHCVGHTERYFDRILQRETYICFLRRQQSPEEPYYTIEVEPGGTIRQHRGEYDEEPEIEKVKPFLRKWQKEIRQRMSRQDHEYAKTSAIKREQNLAELREKNNTRVLEGLMEDLMEVI